MGTRLRLCVAVLFFWEEPEVKGRCMLCPSLVKELLVPFVRPTFFVRGKADLLVSLDVPPTLRSAASDGPNFALSPKERGQLTPLVGRRRRCAKRFET